MLVPRKGLGLLGPRHLVFVAVFRGFVREQQAAGIAKAKAEDVYKGRPVSLDHEQIRTLHSQGIGATAITRQLGYSRGTIYKALSAA